MKPLTDFAATDRQRIRGVFTDIDDTLTTDGALRSGAFAALERLHDAGFLCVPVTGRPAGWCDHIARMWPVDAVVGENGAFYFRYDPDTRTLKKRFLLSADERADNRRRLDALAMRILAEVPGVAIASDQPYRVSDLAIDYCEDVPRVSDTAIETVLEIFAAEGATAKVSSIHINGWFGTYDKLGMAKTMLCECFGIDFEAHKADFVFIGDSPNDAPMWAAFPNSVGVANVRAFLGRLDAEPAYVTANPAGEGFAELADALLEARGT
jgi:HAD superfamily hydrolase (TIGR01484 family)